MSCVLLKYLCFDFCRLCYKTYKYTEGNNRPSSDNQISVVHIIDKAGNKCYSQDITDTRENPSV